MDHAFRDGQFLISTNPDLLDPTAIHAYLSRAYWSEGIPQATVERALRHSLCFGVYDGQTQIGLGRVISDYTTFAYICDVYILEPYRGQGLSKKLLTMIKSHPDLQGLRTWMLATRDAHGLYRQFGFEIVKVPERWMEIRHPGIYLQSKDGATS